MKFLSHLGVFILLTLFAACTSSIDGEKAEVTDAETVTETTATTATFKINTTKSLVEWTGSAVGKQHTGTVNLQSGSLETNAKGEIVGGNFIMDMGSIKNTDMEGEYKDKLESHLWSPDFFDVKQFPTATFVLTSVEKAGDTNSSHTVTGNLTMKGITKSVSFGANINAGASTVSASTPSFKIDRATWNVQYGSKSFPARAKDNAVNDEIGLVIRLEASK